MYAIRATFTDSSRDSMMRWWTIFFINADTQQFYLPQRQYFPITDTELVIQIYVVLQTNCTPSLQVELWMKH